MRKYTVLGNLLGMISSVIFRVTTEKVKLVVCREKCILQFDCTICLYLKGKITLFDVTTVNCQY